MTLQPYYFPTLALLFFLEYLQSPKIFLVNVLIYILDA